MALHFLKYPRYAESNGIENSMVAWIKTDSQQNNVSTVNCEP